MVPTAVEQLEHLPAQILADFGLQGLLPLPHACWDGTGLHHGRGWGCHCCSHLCCATSAPRTTRGTEGAACDYPESGQMERGFLIPLHPAAPGCNLLVHGSRAQPLPSLAGALVALGWIRPPSPLQSCGKCRWVLDGWRLV